MKGIERLQKPHESAYVGGRQVFLYVTAFCQALGGATLWISMPFIVKDMGGSDSQVGLYMGMFFLAYVVTLLLGGSFLDRFNAKSVVRIGSGTVAIGYMATCLIVFAAFKGYAIKQPILMLMILSTFVGIMSAMFWPPLMGWVSTGHEGAGLNRRLGIFNLSWSIGNLLGAICGGYLVEFNPIAALLTSSTIAVLSFAAVNLARKPQICAAIENKPDEDQDCDATKLMHWRFVWMARVGIFTAMACTGLFATQVPLLFKFNLGFSESQFGMVIMFQHAISIVIFYLAGKTHSWHYVRSIFWGAHGFLLLGMVLVLNGSVLWGFFIAATVTGCGKAFFYSSNLYYGVSGAKNRAWRMAIHELTLSLGFFAGSAIGGFISDSFGRRAPYWFGICIIAAGVLSQVCIMMRRPRSI